MEGDWPLVKLDQVCNSSCPLFVSDSEVVSLAAIYLLNIFSVTMIETRLKIKSITAIVRLAIVLPSRC